MAFRPHTHADQHGFTLLEVLVATLILSVVIMATYKVTSESTAHWVISEERYFAELFAHNQLASITLASRDNSSGFSLPEASNGSIDIMGKAFHWEQYTQPTENPMFYRVNITVISPQGNNRADLSATFLIPNNDPTTEQSHRSAEEVALND